MVFLLCVGVYKVGTYLLQNNVKKCTSIFLKSKDNPNQKSMIYFNIMANIFNVFRKPSRSLANTFWFALQDGQSYNIVLNLLILKVQQKVLNPNSSFN